VSPAEQRPYPGTESSSNELDALVGFLDFNRSVLERKCAGLHPDELARRSVAPSNLTLWGLVRHMADVERHWFQRRFRGDRIAPLYWTRDQPDADFDALDQADYDTDLAAWRRECEVSRLIVAGCPDLAESAQWGGRDPVNLRWILMHMIDEYARHNGHADLLREAIDGSTGV
jgi:uncharacterized damage-inducible protein DinB